MGRCQNLQESARTPVKFYKKEKDRNLKRRHRHQVGIWLHKEIDKQYLFRRAYHTLGNEEQFLSGACWDWWKMWAFLFNNGSSAFKGARWQAKSNWLLQVYVGSHCFSSAGIEWSLPSRFTFIWKGSLTVITNQGNVMGNRSNADRSTYPSMPFLSSFLLP